MSSLRSGLIRLAHQNPDLRPWLLPLLKEAAKGKDLTDPDQIDAMLDDSSHGHLSFGVDFDGHGSPKSRAQEVIYALGYEEETSGRKNTGMIQSLIAWAKVRGCGPEVAHSYDLGKKDGAEASR